MKLPYKAGEWAALCDRCGFRFYASDLILDHDNYRVCQKCYEPEHPIENLRVPREDPSVPWARPVNPNGPYTLTYGIGLWKIGSTFEIPSVRDVQSLKSNGTAVRVECLNHRFSPYDTITIRGATDSAYNGSFQITYLTPDHFVYTADSAPAADEDPASGVTADGVLSNVNTNTFNRWHVEEWLR